MSLIVTVIRIHKTNLHPFFHGKRSAHQNDIPSRVQLIRNRRKFLQRRRNPVGGVVGAQSSNPGLVIKLLQSRFIWWWIFNLGNWKHRVPFIFPLLYRKIPPPLHCRNQTNIFELLIHSHWWLFIKTFRCSCTHVIE